MEVSADTVKAIRSLCEDIMEIYPGSPNTHPPLQMRAIAILAALDMQERRHGATKPPG